MLKDRRRRDARKWLTDEFNENFKGKIKNEESTAAHSPGRSAGSPGRRSQGSTPTRLKWRKVSAAAFFAESDEEESEEEHEPTHKDELKAYFDVPQIKYKSEQDLFLWWQEHGKEFPNLAVMAHQYLGCPATSASVERLFSKVGLAFTKKRKKNSESATLESLMFARANLPQGSV